MKTLKLFTAILAFGAIMSMSSCLKNDGSSYKVTSDLQPLFNAVTDLETGEITLYDNESISVDWEHVTGLATVKINGLKLPDGASYPSLQFNDVKWGANSKGWMEIQMTDRKPDAATGYVSDLVFNRFNLAMVNRTYNGLAFPPCMSISYTINNRYQINALPTEIIEIGDTKVTDQNGKVFTQSDANRSIYYIMLSPATKKGFIVVQGAQFAEGMPAMNMKFPNIPFEVNAAGYITLVADTITPSLMSGTSDINSPGTPQENYPITNLRCTYVPNVGVNMTFTCTPKTKDGREMGKFLVDFDCKFPTASTASN